MKTFLSAILALICLPPVLGAVSERPAASDAVLKVLREPLPVEVRKRDGFLWDHFANKPEEEKFSSYTTEKWKDNFAAFTEARAAKASDQKLDSASLRKALDVVLKHSKGEIAYLPAGAYQTTLSGKLVWIITVKWEYPNFGEANPHWGTFGYLLLSRRVWSKSDTTRAGK